MSTWEYKVVTTEKGFWSGKDKTDLEELLNGMGKDGWELISVVPLSHAGAGQTTTLQLFLKRKRF